MDLSLILHCQSKYAAPLLFLVIHPEMYINFTHRFPYRIEEDVTNVLGNSVGTTAAKRRKVLGNPKKAASFHYNTEHVYTFHTYDER